MTDDSPARDILIAQTKHLRLIDRSGWSFVERQGNTGVVCIVPVTNEGELVLVEQYRPPVDATVIELPAGLAGDLEHMPDESLLEAAQRELLEETGYAASEWEHLITAASSPGLTDEMITYFLARDLRREHAGGGDHTEDITVRVVPLDEIEDWLAQAACEGKKLDVKVHAGIYFARR